MGIAGEGGRSCARVLIENACYLSPTPFYRRYIQSDPIGLNGGVNTFVYAASSPLKLFDVYGLDSMCGVPGCLGMPPTTNCGFVVDCVDRLDRMYPDLVDLPESIPNSLRNALGHIRNGLITELGEDVLINMICGHMNYCQCDGSCPTEPSWPEEPETNVGLKQNDCGE